MDFPFPTLLITILATIAVKAELQITKEKEDSGGDSPSEERLVSSFNVVDRTLQSEKNSQTEKDATLQSNAVSAAGKKQEVTSPVPTGTYLSDNFEDLRGRLSKKTLDLIKRLHMQYLNTANLKKQRGLSSSGESKFNKEEVVHVSGKLEIL